MRRGVRREARTENTQRSAHREHTEKRAQRTSRVARTLTFALGADPVEVSSEPVSYVRLAPSWEAHHRVTLLRAGHRLRLGVPFSS